MTARNVSRRTVLQAAGLSAAAFALPSYATASPANRAGFRDLYARPGVLRPRGADQPPIGVWGYEGAVPGPLIRIRRGEEVKVRLSNALPEPTLIHWHGVRLPNAMDGVPDLTQAPVNPGDSFEYRFKALDAGTFWYHAQTASSAQLERGLYGVLIADELATIDVDKDLVLVLDDWRLTDGNPGSSPAQDSNQSGAADLLTANSEQNLTIPARPNDRIRLRLLNATHGRLMPVSIPNVKAWVMAIDGQPAEPFVARGNRVVLAPGNRIDLFVDVPDSSGSVPILVDNGVQPVAVARIVSEGTRRTRLPDEPKPLPANPLPSRINLKSALRLDVSLDSGMPAKFRSLADRPASDPPLFSVQRGRPVVLAFINGAASPSVMHLHGHHFRLLDNLDDGWKPFWFDTLLLAPRQTSRIAFVADNPGKWMIRCGMLGVRPDIGAWFEVN